MRTHTPRYLLLLLAVLLSACAAFPSAEKQHKSELDDFMYALRWQRYPEAAAFFAGEHRGIFLDQMDALKDLNITDVRLKRFELKEDRRRAETRLEMDYYILPSATLKTLRIDQTWVYFETSDSEHSCFLITTPFPKFPEELSRKKSTLPP